ncbi:MAG: ImmA/IrrE family metallo-endopeptidase, partial [Longimicrobiales bacterium]
EFEKLAADTRYAIRQGYAWQESLRELTNRRNPAERLITRLLSAAPGDDVVALAAHVREALGVTLDEQRSWNGREEAFKQWRNVIEGAGVFVFKRSFEQRNISGFSLDDPEFPIIVINNTTAHSRQTFTLCHELAHLVFDVSGITQVDDSYIRRLNGRGRSIEVACNQFAAELLFPEASFPWHLFHASEDLMATVSDVADDYGVSREAVLRRLLDRGIVDQATYLSFAQQWTDEYLEQRGRTKGGNFYATQAAYLGENFLNLAFGLYRAGRVTRPELAEHLGVKARNLDRLEEFLLTRT